MKKNYIVPLLVLISFAALSAGQNTVASNSTTTTVMNASNATISFASNFIIEKVGSTYFSNYIKYGQGNTYSYPNGSVLSVLFYSYSIPFQNGTTTTGIIRFGRGASLALAGAEVVISNGNVTYYSGPSSPFVVAIGPQSAASAATAYGLVNVTQPYVSAASAPSSGNLTGYQVVWAVASGTKTLGLAKYPKGVFKGVYVNIQNGSVIGQFVINSGLVGSSQYSLGMLGNYGLYNSTPKATATTVAATTAPQSNVPIYAPVYWQLPVFIIVVIIVLLLMRRNTGKPAAKGARRKRG